MEGGNSSSNSSGMMHRARRSTRSLDFAIPYTAVSGTFSLIGGVSNLLVMFILVKYVGMKHNTYVYMLSLFLSDFLYNVVVQPQVCFYQFPTSTITLFGMYYIHGASLMCILTGTSCLFFASLDKLIFIKYPFFHITKNKTRVVVVCIWLACFGLGVMRFFNVIFITDGYLAIIATLFLLTILVQILIFVVARDQDKRIQQVHRSLGHNHPHDQFGHPVPAPRLTQGSNKAARTIGFLLAVYISSWLPVNIYRFEYRWNDGNAKVYHTWVKVINILIQVHSCINPWIFVFRTTDMKVGLGKMMRSLGVDRFYKCLVDERAGEAIFGSNGCNVTASSRVPSNYNVFSSEDGAGNIDSNDGSITISCQDQSGNNYGGNTNASSQGDKSALVAAAVARKGKLEGQENAEIQTPESKDEQNPGHESNSYKSIKSENGNGKNEAEMNGSLTAAQMKGKHMNAQSEDSENKSNENTLGGTSDTQNQSVVKSETNSKSGIILKDRDQNDDRNTNDLVMSEDEGQMNNIQTSSFGESAARY